MILKFEHLSNMVLFSIEKCIQKMQKDVRVYLKLMIIVVCFNNKGIF